MLKAVALLERPGSRVLVCVVAVAMTWPLVTRLTRDIPWGLHGFSSQRVDHRLERRVFWYNLQHPYDVGVGRGLGR